MLDDILWIRVSSIAAIVGSLMYVAGDMLLLAVKADADSHPRTTTHAADLGGMERLAALHVGRIAPGGLLGVFGAPLILAGWWVLYLGLRPSGEVLATLTAILFAVSTVLGAFVHGWFMAIADDVRLLDRVAPADAATVLEVIGRHRRILAVAYVPLAVAVMVASVLTVVVVIGGSTGLPTWFALANPIVLLIAFLIARRLMPAGIAERFEGTGFSVAYVGFFVALAVAAWNGFG